MAPMLRFVVGVLVGGASSWAAVAWVAPGGEGVLGDPAVATPVGEAVAPDVREAAAPGGETSCDAARGALEDEIVALEGKVRVAGFRRQLAESRLRQVGGAPLPWPDDADARLEPENVAAVVGEALAAVEDEGDLLDLDCSEYPCIAYFGQPPEEGGGTAAWAAMDARLGEALPGLRISSSASRVDGLLITATAIWDHSTEDADLRPRLDVRFRATVDALSEVP